MFLQYLQKKRNKDKITKEVDFLYSNSVKIVRKIIFNLENKPNSNFNETFEVMTILLFCIFFGFKQSSNPNNTLINQELMKIFIKDLDQSLTMEGVGDMKIGKYVKSYVKKFYFRVKKLEIVFENDNIEDFNRYLKDRKLVLDHEYLYVNLNKVVERSKKCKNLTNLYQGLFN